MQIFITAATSFDLVECVNCWTWNTTIH